MLFSKSKDIETEIKFYQWMLENWTMQGGLIPQATAARLMMISKARVTQMIKEGKLKEFRFEKQVYVSYAETMKYARNRVYQEIEKNEDLVKE